MSNSIYGIEHPITKELVYVGKTSGTIKHRLCCHISLAKKDGKKNKLYAWIKSLLNQDLLPEIFLIESCEDNNVNESERFYIEYFKSIGCNLKNMQPGGDGQPKGYKFKKRYIPPKNKLPKGFEYGHGWNKGKSPSKESIEKQKITTSKNGKLFKPVIAKNIETNEEIYFKSIRIAAEILNIKKCNISYALHHKTLVTLGKYIFKFPGEEFKIKISRKIKISKYNEEEKITYESILEAAKLNQLHRKTIYYYLSQNKKFNGYHFKYE